MTRIRTIQDVVDYRLCIGCGACVHVLGADAATMVDHPLIGLRPKFTRELTAEENDAALSVCPGIQIETNNHHENSQSTHESSFDDVYAGRGLKVWEGYAADPEIRLSGSSGGIVTALSLFCLERLGVQVVSHIGMDAERPWSNRNILSSTRADLLRGLGSRYVPSSPCLSLTEIESISGKAVFVGKPCDAAAVALVQKQKPELRERITAVISFFCAGTPSSGAAVELLQEQRAEPEKLASVKFRGEGWPGRFRALDRAGREVTSLSYADSWGALQKSRGLRCSLCADGMAELADIACGDAWHRYADDGSPGVSVVIARTPRGLEIVEAAWREGYIVLEPAGVASVIASQGSAAGLIRRRSEVWGRLLALGVCGLPRPRYKGVRILGGWVRIPLSRKIKSVFGTFRRVVRKRLYSRLSLHE